MHATLPPLRRPKSAKPRRRTDRVWRTYELVAQALLNEWAREFGISHVEGKRAVLGRRTGTTWEIDARGVNEGTQAFVLVEARRYTKKRLNQESIAALAYRIIDTGASGAIVVSPLGLQKGAKRVADAENIVSVRLAPHSTNRVYLMQFLDRVMIGLPHESLSVSSTLVGGTLKTVTKHNEA